MENISAKDLQILREKSRTFCGAFRIPLDKLRSEDLSKNPRQRDSKNIARLLNTFQKDSCQRREPENHVPALVSRSCLPPNSNGGIFGEPPLFVPEAPLRILHGAHRLEAARSFLQGSDRWWVADIYSDDINSTVQNELREQDTNSSKWFDGDIIRQIRLSTLANDRPRREKWLARFSKSKRTCYLRLEASPGVFSDGWDSLISFPGLWPSVQAGTFPRLLNLHCPEEIIRCSQAIRETWTYIVGDKEEDQIQLDANTVAILQGRCPILSTDDRTFIRTQMLAGEVLPAVKDDGRRSEIFDRICSTKRVIPSLYTCIENTKWLEPGVRILKEMLPENGKGSLSQQFRLLHNGQANVNVQTSEFTVENRTSASGDSFWLSYRQLFLFALRHFPVMDGQAPRKDAPKQSSSTPGIQQRWWHEISSLAAENGYRGLRRKYHDRQAADARTIEDCVRSILPSKYYQIDSVRMRRIIQLNCHLMRHVPYAERMKVSPELCSDYDGCGSDITDRCGRPYDQSLQADQENLFIDHIYSASYSTVPKRYLTSFAVKRDIFHSFFGFEEDNLDRQLRSGNLRNTVLMDIIKSEATDSAVHSAQNEEVEEVTRDFENPELQLPGHNLLLPQNEIDTKEDSGQPQPSGNRSPIYTFGQQNPDDAVSLVEASRLLFKHRSERRMPMLTVLSHLGSNKFKKRQADALDTVSMVAALDLPSNSRFIARDSNKRLKMTAPTAILDGARSQQLQTVLMVQQPNIQELIRRFEDCNSAEEEL